MLIKLQPRPLQNITQTADDGKWTVTGLPARLELFAHQTSLPSGWVLLRGLLHRRGRDYSASLIAEVKDEQGVSHEFPLPVTRKGTMLELFFLPKGVVRLTLEPMRSLGEFELSNLSLTPVGPFERTVRMYRRVIPLFFKQSSERRRRAGLRAYTPFLDLRKAYEIAGRFRAYAPELSYEKWIEVHEKLTDGARKLIRRQVRRWRGAPRFEIVISADDPESSSLHRTLTSLQGQLFDNFRVTLPATLQAGIDPELLPFCRGVEVLRTASEDGFAAAVQARLPADGGSTWVVVLQAGAVLAEHALYWLASEAMQNKDAMFIYADHDHLGDDGKRRDPVFKPDWSPELLRSTNYIGPSAAVRSDALARAGGLVSADLRDPDTHDLYLRVSELLAGEAVAHIPAVLWHLPVERSEERERASLQMTNPVEAHLRRLGVPASAERTAAGHYRVRYELPPDPPLVSIVVPTRDALNHLRACVESVLEKSSYKNIELLVVDNRSTDPQALAYLAALAQRPGVRVLRYDQPFNYSAINNYAAGLAVGEVLCLLNNDAEVITPGWIEDMLGHLLQPRVGAVGAKLLFGDGRVQHAGDTVGPGGCAHHLHSMIERDAPGYCNRAILAQELSSVTAACLLTWRSLFRELGGLDECNLPVAFNDVDYCLRVREAGYRVIWTPYAELYHHESVSRGADNGGKDKKRLTGEAKYMRKRWKHVMDHDPYYNPNLSYERPDFSLSNAPLVKRPWQER